MRMSGREFARGVLLRGVAAAGGRQASRAAAALLCMVDAGLEDHTAVAGRPPGSGRGFLASWCRSIGVSIAFVVFCWSLFWPSGSALIGTPSSRPAKQAVAGVVLPDSGARPRRWLEIRIGWG